MEFFNIYNQEYENIIKSNLYKIHLKVEFLDHFENTICDISDKINLEESNSITVNYEQGLRRTCSLSLQNVNNEFLPNENSLVWINQKIKIYLGVSSTNSIYWWSQGVFVIKEVEVSNDKVNINCVDKFGFFTEDLNQHCLQGTYKIPYGTNAYSAITGTLSMNMGNDLPIDTIEPNIDINISSEYLPYDITKDADSYLGDILIELGTSLNSDVYYDTNGIFIVTKSKIDEYPREAPTWFLNEFDSNMSELNINYNLGSVINVCKVYGTDVDGLIHSYIAKNTNPCSPTRISLIGEKCEKAEESDMCYDDKHCHDYAWYQLNQKSAVNMSVSFDTTLIPHLDVNRIISISNKNYNLYNEHFLITSLTIPIGLSTMKISAVNIKYLPAYSDSDNL